MNTKQQRVEHANQLIDVIATHGRRFFYRQESGRVARLELDARGRVWLIDEYSGARIYTHDTPFGNNWRGFSHGGTMRGLIERMRDYITSGVPLNSGCIAPPMSYGDMWGYGEDAAAAVRAAAAALPIMVTAKARPPAPPTPLNERTLVELAVQHRIRFPLNRNLIEFAHAVLAGYAAAAPLVHAQEIAA